MSLVQVKSIRLDIDDETKYLSVYNSVDNPYFELDKVCRLMKVRGDNKISVISPENISKQKIQTNGGIQLKNMVNYEGALEVIFSTHTSIAKAIKPIFISKMKLLHVYEMNQKQFQLEEQNRVLQIENQETKDLLEQLRIYNVQAELRNRSLETEKEELETEKQALISYKNVSRRFITPSEIRTQNDPHIKIKDRLIDFHFYNVPHTMTHQWYRELTKSIDFVCQCGCGMLHRLKNTGYYIFKNHITCISMKLSLSYKRNLNTYPSILSTNRVNKYNLAFYREFGDEIIREYLNEHPFQSWNIPRCHMFENSIME